MFWRGLRVEILSRFGQVLLDCVCLEKREKREMMEDWDEILKELEGLPRTSASAGEVLWEQGSRSGVLIFLIEGEIEVLEDGLVVERENRPGSVFGELSALLDNPHLAQLRAASDSVVVRVASPLEFLVRHPKINLHVCRMLAGRLTAATRYLVDVRRQFSKEPNHLAMLDKILTTLIRRNPKLPAPERTAVLPEH